MIPQTERDEDEQVEPLDSARYASFRRRHAQVADKFFDREQANDTQTAAAEDLIMSCSIPPFNATLFSNPKLAKFYACLQALALNKDDIEDEEEDDNVFGDEDGMREFAAAPAEALIATLPAATEKVAAGGKKRKKPTEPIDPVVAKQMKFDYREYHNAGTLKNRALPH